MSTHIGANRGDYARTVLLPGDPLRAKHIADNFINDGRRVNSVRNMLGYTGTTSNGKPISAQGTGMGMPSLSIYCTELIVEFGVKRLIRVGTCGSFSAELPLGSLILAAGACTDSAMNVARFGAWTFSPLASWELLLQAHQVCQELGLKVTVGNVLSTDTFYSEDPEGWKMWAQYGVLAAEMEAYELYTLAAKHHVEALTILTVSDSLATGDRMSAEQREQTLDNMVRVAVKLA